MSTGSYNQPSRTRATMGRRLREAARIRARWRAMGFDRVTCADSGSCWPVNSAACPSVLPENCRIHPIDSDDALLAIARAVSAGYLSGV